MNYHRFSIFSSIKYFRIVVLLFLLAVVHNVHAQTYDYDALMKRIQLDAGVGIKDVGTLDAWVSSQNANGSWNTFGYGKLSASNAMNTTDNHVLRLWHLAAAVSKTNHAKYNNSSYKSAIKNGLAYWYQSETTDLNWWYNRIYCPQKLGEILVFLREFDNFIPQTTDAGIDEPEILSLFQPQSIPDITLHGTGANAIDISLHYIYRGILTQNALLLERTRDRLEAMLTENIKSDLVFHDHGPQIQISSYGWVFADGIIRLASYLASSPAEFDLQSENFSKVIRFIREIQISSVRGTSWDFSVMGRAVSRVNALNAGMAYLQKMADIIDPENATVYLDALNRMKGNQSPNYKVREFNKHYWASDYTQHARKDYLFTVRNVSLRTVEAETGNDENLKANYFSYGANFISVDGSEYKNIMPYWDWCMIPGTTYPYTTSYPTRKTWGSNFGTSSFVGGVSDENYGAAVLDLNLFGMKAKKSWFFFDNEVVCLGAGITDNSNRNVRTTLNQTKMETPSYYTEIGNPTEKMHSVSAIDYSNTNLSYLRNGKTAYFFPTQSNLKYSMKSQSGTWKSININGSNTVESGYVFSLWFDHGQNPANDSYSYIVVPGIDTKEKAQKYDPTAIEIISNSPTIQAVTQKNLNIIQVVFHSAASLTYGNTKITVNRPCALMLKNGTYVTIADPAQANVVIDVEVKVDGASYRKFISMPAGNGMQGASTTVDFEIPTGINPIAAGKDIELKCFPNPTNTGIVNLNVNSENAMQAKVLNSKGQIVYNTDFMHQTTIDLQTQASGVYLLSVSDNDRIFNRKIIKH